MEKEQISLESRKEIFKGQLTDYAVSLASNNKLDKEDIKQALREIADKI